MRIKYCLQILFDAEVNSTTGICAYNYRERKIKSAQTTYMEMGVKIPKGNIPCFCGWRLFIVGIFHVWRKNRVSHNLAKIVSDKRS